MISKQKIKDIHALKLKKNRDRSGLFVGEGPKVVGELLQTFDCAYIASTKEWFSENEHLLNNNINGQNNNIVCDTLSAAELSRASLMETPQQVIGIFHKKAQTLPPHDILHTKLCLALDTVQDPGNIGTILRLARWFGIDNIVCSPDCVDIYSPKVVQATMGALGKVSIGYISLPEFLNSIPKDVPVYGTFLDGDNIYQSNLATHGIIVMGNEGNGISKDVACHINHRLYIPPYPAGVPAIESLNVGVATAIVCAEFRRRQAAIVTK